MFSSKWSKVGGLHDEQAYVNAIDTRASEHTRRAGRNVVSISAAVLFIAWCELEIADIKFIGLELDSSHEHKLLAATALLLLYWLISYLLNLFQDSKLQIAKVRASQIPLESELRSHRAKGKKANSELIADLEESIKKLNLQRGETRGVRLINWLLVRIEIFVTLLFCAFGFVVLCKAS